MLGIIVIHTLRMQGERTSGQGDTSIERSSDDLARDYIRMQELHFHPTPYGSDTKFSNLL